MASIHSDTRIDDLGAELNGELIMLDDPGYEEARAVFLKGVDRHPSRSLGSPEPRTSHEWSPLRARAASSWPSAAAATAWPVTGRAGADSSSISPR